MKNTPILIVLVFTLVFLAFNSRNKEKHLESIGFRFIPSGTMEYNGNKVAMQSFFIFQTEITNKQYQEFLHHLKKEKQYDKLRICRIDSLKWNEALPFENTYALDYHLTSQFAEYPVVNISYEAALLFCDWLQQKVQNKVNNAIVRLPDENEWIYAAKGGKPDAVYPWENIATKGKSDIEHCNYNSPDDGTCLATNYANAYYANAYGLYNMSGNVAEWLNAAGNTKGGSWGDDALHMRIDADDNYLGITSPSPYIGFRPVVVLQ